jgi:hypothetical protein
MSSVGCDLIVVLPPNRLRDRSGARRQATGHHRQGMYLPGL